jgi:ribonuclease HIII
LEQWQEGSEIYTSAVYVTKAEDKYTEVAAAAVMAKSKYNSWLVDYMDSKGIPYQIGKRLNSNLIWEEIKSKKIILNDPNSFVKDWSKKNSL